MSSGANLSSKEYEGKRKSKMSSDDDGSRRNQLCAGIETCHNDDGRRLQRRHFPDSTNSNIFGEMQIHGTDVFKGTFEIESNFCGQMQSDSTDVSKRIFSNVFDDIESDRTDVYKQSISNVFSDMQSDSSDGCKDFRKRKSLLWNYGK